MSDLIICGHAIEEMLSASVSAAIHAGEAIIEVYNSDFAVEQKDDKSPLTLADKRAHNIISGRLSGFTIPLLSEEGRDIPYSERRHWDLFWLVDPLDGTKEFVKRNGEFTVNIALIHQSTPVLGVIYVPVTRRLYFAAAGIGAFLVQESSDLLTDEKKREGFSGSFESLMACSIKLPLSPGERPFTIVGSRSHPSAEFEEFTGRTKAAYGTVDIVSSGSSLKFCLVAEERADLYPRFGPTMEWDTAAGQAIVEQAGGRVLDMRTRLPLGYNKESLLNPFFIVGRHDIPD